MVRAINALYCAVTNIGTNFWNVFGAIWFFALEFKFEGEITKYVAEYYPYVCTCNVESQAFMKLAGAMISTMVTMGGCSEKVQIAAAETEAKAAK